MKVGHFPENKEGESRYILYHKTSKVKAITYFSYFLYFCNLSGMYAQFLNTQTHCWKAYDM